MKKAITMSLSLVVVLLLTSCTNTQRNPAIKELEVYSNETSGTSTSSPVPEKTNQKNQGCERNENKIDYRAAIVPKTIRSVYILK